MSLLQDVLRPTNPRDVDAVSSRLNKLSVPDDSPASSRVTSPTPRGGSDSSDEDELIGVVRPCLLPLPLCYVDPARKGSIGAMTRYLMSWARLSGPDRALEEVPLSSSFSVVWRMTPCIYRSESMADHNHQPPLITYIYHLFAQPPSAIYHETGLATRDAPPPSIPHNLPLNLSIPPFRGLIQTRPRATPSLPTLH